MAGNIGNIPSSSPAAWGLLAQVGATGPPVSSMAFSAVTAGANTSSLTIGAGGSLTPSGGTITANNLSAGTYGISISGNAATATTAAAATTATTAAAVPFSGVTAGTNTTALRIGSGGTLDATGTGTITATQLSGPFGIPSAAVVVTSEATTSTTYTDLSTAGPAVTATVSTTGKALVTITARYFASSATGSCFMGFAVSGATTVAASDTQALEKINDDPAQMSATFLVTGLNSGSNTFTAQYHRTGGTGGSPSCTFANRNIIVTPY